MISYGLPKVESLDYIKLFKLTAVKEWNEE